MVKQCVIILWTIVPINFVIIVNLISIIFIHQFNWWLTLPFVCRSLREHCDYQSMLKEQPRCISISLVHAVTYLVFYIDSLMISFLLLQVLCVIDSSYHILNDMKNSSAYHLREQGKHAQKQDKLIDYKEKISVVIPHIGISLINSYPQVYGIILSSHFPWYCFKLY